MSTPNITLYFLQASRSIRIAWLLEELSLPYESIFFPRENNKAPADFKSRSGNTLGKAPSLTDGSLTMNESGAITEYLIEKYDKDGKLMGGKDEEKRNKIRMWIHAAEDVYGALFGDYLCEVVCARECERDRGAEGIREGIGG